MKKDEAPAPAPAAQQNAPAEKIAPAPNADSKQETGRRNEGANSAEDGAQAPTSKAAQNPANDNAKTRKTPGFIEGSQEH